MTKTLYTCTATYDTETLNLTSYKTEVVSFEYRGDWRLVIINRYSQTTQSHIRKYIKRLRELGFYLTADLLEQCYKDAVRSKNKLRAMVYNSATGEIIFHHPDLIRDLMF